MLLRLSGALFLLLVIAATWSWWIEQPSPDLGDVDPAMEMAAVRSFQEGQALREDAAQARIKFAEAADLFENLSDTFPSPDVYFNLGNVSLLADRLPEAILAFQRGLALNPDDTGLRRHLQYARALVAYGPGERGKPSADRWPLWLPTPRTLLRWGAVLAYVACLPLILLTWTTRRIRPFLLACLFGAACGMMGWLALQPRENRPLIVIARDDVPLRQGNGPSFPHQPALPYLSRGMEARLIARRGDWLFIEFATGEMGWIPDDTTG